MVHWPLPHGRRSESGSQPQAARGGINANKGGDAESEKWLTEHVDAGTLVISTVGTQQPKSRGSAMATVHSVLTDLLDPLADCMTPEVAGKVIRLRASADANNRMQFLADKSAAGTLTDDEQEEYEACVSAGTFIAILQAKARRMLGNNGAA